jgi:hypothetical protein
MKAAQLVLHLVESWVGSTAAKSADWKVVKTAGMTAAWTVDPLVWKKVVMTAGYWVAWWADKWEQRLVVLLEHQMVESSVARLVA